MSTTNLPKWRSTRLDPHPLSIEVSVRTTHQLLEEPLNCLVAIQHGYHHAGDVCRQCFQFSNEPIKKEQELCGRKYQCIWKHKYELSDTVIPLPPRQKQKEETSSSEQQKTAACADANSKSSMMSNNYWRQMNLLTFYHHLHLCQVLNQWHPQGWQKSVLCFFHVIALPRNHWKQRSWFLLEFMLSVNS